ncbi:MAG: phosphate butyryltransferase, partial [Bacillota bacterium]
MYRNFSELIEKVRSCREPFIVSVAAAEDEELLRAVKNAAELGLIRPVLTGKADVLNRLCKEIGLSPLDILPADDDAQAAAAAVGAVKAGG